MAENRTEIKQREYLIGDMSEIVGVSRDTLRFYEKKGIIKARKKENGYRYYLEEDLFRLMVILYKRKMNDSLEEIEGYIKGENSVEYMKKHLQTRIKQEEMKIHYHQQAIARMRLATKDIQMAEQYLFLYRIFHKRRADAGAGHQAVSVSGSRSLYQQ